MFCLVVRYRESLGLVKSLAATKSHRFRSQDRHEQDRQRRGREFSRAFCRVRAEPCNIQFRLASISAWPVWNGTDTHSALAGFSLRLRLVRSDWRSRSTRRSRLQRSGNAPLLSRRFNRRASQVPQMFSSGSSSGATGPELTVSGGTLSVAEGATAGLASNEGCLMRVAMSIAVNNIAAAR
jgi:hypothetical protein